MRVLEMSLRSSFSLADVTCLDELIMEHHRLFLKVRVTSVFLLGYTVCFSVCYTV